MNHLKGMDFTPEQFVLPPRECNVIYAWFWNSPITKELIDRQLSEAAEAGIKGMYIAPLPKDFRPDTMRTFLEPEYLTKEFFELIRYAIRKGLELGMEIWLYDEGGWPSGGACGHTMRENSETAMDILAKRTITVNAGETYIRPEEVLAVFDGRKRLPDTLTAETDLVLTEYVTEAVIENGNRVDCTNAGVTDTFIENTYEKYKECVGDLFGTDVSMIFTDEPGILRCTLPKGFFARFEEEYGYDAKGYLHVIEDEDAAETEQECQARMDYGRLLGLYFKENFCQRLADWCGENGILFGGHLDVEHVPDGAMRRGYYSHVDALRAFDVPGIDVIWEQIRYPYSGRTPVEEGSVFFPRVAPSAARQAGRNLSLTETFGVFGDSVTPDEMRYVVNYQAIRGINVFNFMIMTSGRSRATALVERPVFCAEKPGYFHLAHSNAYFARLSYLTRLGEAEGNTALYYPANDFWTNTEILNAAVEAYNETGRRLEEKNIPFDIIDDAGILAAEETEEGLRLGSAVYQHIVVPACRFMPEAVREKIAPYLSEGEPLLAVKSPNLRFMTRKLAAGRLYFVFNQGVEAVSETLPIGEGRKLYQLDLTNGEMYLEERAHVQLLCGEMAVYLVTDVSYPAYPAACKQAEYAVEVTGLFPAAYKQFCISRDGVFCEYGEGAAPCLKKEQEAAEESFSGEITYRGSYQLPHAPKAGERYRVVLEDTSVSVSVSLDGQRIATAGMSPMMAMLPAEKLRECGEIEITVANTAANEILAKREVLHSLPAAEIGPYYPKMYPIEEARPALKLGKVWIEKLRICF